MSSRLSRCTISEVLSEYKLGQGADKGTIIGTLINKGAQSAMVEFVENAIVAGDKLMP